jgi:hypothetical protein
MAMQSLDCVDIRSLYGLSFYCKMSQQLLNLGCPEGECEYFDPVSMRRFSSDTVMFQPNLLANLLQQPGRLGPEWCRFFCHF